LVPSWHLCQDRGWFIAHSMRRFVSSESDRPPRPSWMELEEGGKQNICVCTFYQLASSIPPGLPATGSIAACLYLYVSIRWNCSQSMRALNGHRHRPSTPSVSKYKMF
jgi:hypothetical protein